MSRFVDSVREFEFFLRIPKLLVVAVLTLDCLDWPDIFESSLFFIYFGVAICLFCANFFSKSVYSFSWTSSESMFWMRDCRLFGVVSLLWGKFSSIENRIDLFEIPN